MGLFDRLFGSRQATDAAPLYAAIVAQARAPHWYIDGGVADSVDGRFDMIAAILSLVLIRLEDDAAQTSVALTERFIEDMDAQLREDGVGDVGLGKQVGKMISMLGGRLSAYRDGLASGDLTPVLTRNLYRGVTATPPQMAHVASALTGFADRLRAAPVATLVAGTLP
jgi:cytochrome b pre-mRNA-processing protein 3